MDRKRLILLLSALIFLTAACSNSSDTAQSSFADDIVFKSIDEIISQPLEVTNFASDGSASLPIQTSVPVACTIVYGPTPEFGSLSLDQDMAGGTHSDHNPLLSSLDPETEYFFRVQGVDDDGTIYLSDVMTFSTPALEESETTNLLSPDLGAEILGFSSAFGGAGQDDRWGAGSALDDNPNTEWSSAGDGNSAWIEVELASRALIESIAFHSRSMSDGSAVANRFTVTTGEGEEYGPYDVPDAENAYTFETVIEAKIVRFTLMDTTGGNTGAVDIAAYGQFVEG